MPSISVTAPHVSYIESLLDEPQRFLQQCDIIQQWQTIPLIAYDQLGLSLSTPALVQKSPADPSLATCKLAWSL